METTELTLKEALQKINELGYKYIRIAYHGGGDSGDTESPDFYETKEYLDNQRISTFDYKKEFEEQKRRREICAPFTKPIISKVDRLLTDIEDWWNNDGGFGHIEINTETGEYHIDNNVNYTESTNYTHEGNLE